MGASKSLDELRRAFNDGRTGVWSYVAGVSGSRTITGKIQSILAHSTAGGSFTVNGGDSIPVPANTGFAFAPEGNLVNATFVFTNTDMYLIEYTTG